MPPYVAMVGILKLASSGSCWISALNGKVEVDWAASVFLAANSNFSSLALSSFISSLIGETNGTSSLLLEVANVHLASRCVRMSSPRLRPSRLKTLCDGLKAYSVTSLSRDLTVASGPIVQLNAVFF